MIATLINNLGCNGGKQSRFSFGISIQSNSKARVFCWATIVSDARPEPAVLVEERGWRLEDSLMTGRDELLRTRDCRAKSRSNTVPTGHGARCDSRPRKRGTLQKNCYSRNVSHLFIARCVC